ncbi:MAG: endonuclease/exonuclease/phosphatase family protein [Puniceicoccales bacterium]|jgi:endonuclease/exonuclease/phosphatase family metal-dependent hydrolase|nr:endonuclease/exonuclease/phosphatase family protein [Puniceicoccales bacterium]
MRTRTFHPALPDFGTFRRALAVALGALLAVVSTAGECAAERLRVATFNVRNYTLERRRVAGVSEPDYPKPEAEKAALRLVILAAGADLVCLQEIGGGEFVNELRRDLAREGGDYPHQAVLDGPDPRRRLAFLSRRPFKAVLRHATVSASLPAPPAVSAKAKSPSPAESRSREVARGLLGVVLGTGAGDVAVYTLHLKSRLTTDQGDPQAAGQRLAEAEAVRALLASGHAGDAAARVLVCGDFNDAPTSKTLRVFTDGRRFPKLRLLPAADSRGETWTYRNERDDYYARSDYFLLSPALEPFARTPARIADIAAAGAASDHRLVFADFNFPDAPAGNTSAVPPAPRSEPRSGGRP